MKLRLAVIPYDDLTEEQQAAAGETEADNAFVVTYEVLARFLSDVLHHWDAR